MEGALRSHNVFPLWPLVSRRGPRHCLVLQAGLLPWRGYWNSTFPPHPRRVATRHQGAFPDLAPSLCRGLPRFPSHQRPKSTGTAIPAMSRTRTRHPFPDRVVPLLSVLRYSQTSPIKQCSCATRVKGRGLLDKAVAHGSPLSVLLCLNPNPVIRATAMSKSSRRPGACTPLGLSPSQHCAFPPAFPHSQPGLVAGPYSGNRVLPSFWL